MSAEFSYQVFDTDVAARPYNKKLETLLERM